MSRAYLLTAALLLILGLSHSRAADPPATQPATFTGTLTGGMAAVGGETTGWVLVGAHQAGGLDVDVSGVKDQAKRFDGAHVKVTGKLKEVSFRERGKTPVLVAEKIEPAPEKARQQQK